MGRIESTALSALNSYGTQLSRLGTMKNSETDSLLLLWFLNYMATESDSLLRFCDNAGMFVQDTDTSVLINKAYDNVINCLSEQSCLIWPDAALCSGDMHYHWDIFIGLDNAIITHDTELIVTNDDSSIVIVPHSVVAERDNNGGGSDHDDDNDRFTCLFNILHEMGFITNVDIPSSALTHLESLDVIGNINGINMMFSVSKNYITGSSMLFLNGQRLTCGSDADYVETRGGFRMLRYAPKNDDILTFSALVKQQITENE